jgi:hypothetical protein
MSGNDVTNISNNTNEFHEAFDASYTLLTSAAKTYTLQDSKLERYMTSEQTPPTATTVTKYRMRGYYIAGSAYEFWITTDPTSANPSGNPLVNKSIDSIIAQ